MRKLFSVVFAAALGALVFAAAVNGQENRGRQNAGQQDTGEYIHYRLAMQYKSEKKYDLAISEFRKVLAAYPDHYHTYMHLAEIRRDQGNHKLVIYNLQKALSYNPGWGRAQKMLADAFAADGQPERAIAEFQAYQNVCDPIERDSIQTVIDGLMRRMRGVPSPQQAASKDTAAAVPAPAAPAPAPAAAPRAAAASVRLNPQAEEAMKRVIALYNEKKYDEMLTAVRAVLAIQSNHPGAYYYAGLVRRMNKQVNMAKINFNKALTHPHYGGTAHFHLGAISVEENNRDGAVRHLRAALASKSDQFDREEARRLLESLGVAVDANQPADTAAAAQTTAAADRVISIDKYAPIEIRIDSMLSMMTVDTLSDVGQKLLTGIRSFKENRFDEAILEFRRVLADNPNGPIAAHCLYNIGVCYFKLRLFNDAENQFQLFLNRFPTHRFAPQAFFFRACCFQERGDYAVSERLFRQFIQNHRNHEWVGRAWERLGDSFADLQQHRQAVDAYTQALANASKSPFDQVVLNFKLGNSSVSVGNTNRALTFYAAAADIGEKNNIFFRVPDSHYKIADIKFQQRQFAAALEDYKRVTRRYPAFQETPWGLFQIANIQRNLKQHREAVDTYRELMRLYPDDYWAKQAQWKLEDTIWEHEYRSVKR